MYQVTRHCKINSHPYNSGEIVRAEDIVPYGMTKLQRMGYVVEVPDKLGDNAVTVKLPILTVNGTEIIAFAEAEIISAIEILQMAAGDAAKAVGLIGNQQALRLICALESRKTVKHAAEQMATGAIVPIDESMKPEQDSGGDV